MRIELNKYHAAILKNLAEKMNVSCTEALRYFLSEITIEIPEKIVIEINVSFKTKGKENENQS